MTLERLPHHDVLEEALGISAGDHVCLLYDDSPSEQMPAIIVYLKQGLAEGERCIYVADDLSPAELTALLRDGGIDVEAELERGALLLWTRREWRQPGILDTVRKAAQVRQITESTLAAGFRGVRFAVEMTWMLEPDLDPAAIEAWEATSNQFLQPGAPLSAMCLYGRRRLPAEAVQGALRTHPRVIAGDFSS